ncbi:MAG: hypothetical protein C5B59_17360 [Bacteroidetes bacterium]|nr:MAG: hypothetical protein C5B59_17360 [Bacteroidota bacterium]
MRRSTPYEEGDINSRICFVGEAPSNVELRLGRPFVGPAGMVFEECLHTAGIIRRECYITNVFEFPVYKDEKSSQVRIYKKDGGELLWTATGGFTEEGQLSVQRLTERLEKCKANVICPLGGVASDALCGLPKIMKWRGSILTCDLVPGRKVVPTIHPAAVLRGNYVWRYLIVNDMERIKEESKSPILSLPQANFIIEPGFHETLAWIEKAKQNAKILNFDVEVYHGQISAISFAYEIGEAISIPFVGRTGNHYFTELEELEVWLAIASLLALPIPKVNQNILFDLFMLLYRNNIFVAGPYYDTMVAFNLMYIDFKKDLGTICSIYTRWPYYKDDGKIWKKPFRDMDSFWIYNAKDSVVSLESWLNMQEELDKGYRQTHDETTALYPALLYMMVDGLKVNHKLLQQTRKDIESQLNAAIEDLNKTADYPINALSPKQVAQYIYGHKGAHAYISPKTGKVTTDDLALARLIRRYRWPELLLIQKVRTLNKLKSSYLDVETDPDGRLRTAYNPRGTWTGRLSSSETIFQTGLNMQNLDPSFKEFIVPDD